MTVNEIYMKVRIALVADVDGEDLRRIAAYFDDDPDADERQASILEARRFFRNHGIISGRQILARRFDSVAGPIGYAGDHAIGCDLPPEHTGNCSVPLTAEA